jgi:hypothetical protein
MTLRAVRELLSGPEASAFFEAWVKADSERADAQEQLEELTSQLLVAETRVKAAENVAEKAARDATSEQQRLIGLKGDEKSFVQCEVEALAKVNLTRAAHALEEANERRLRTAFLREQAQVETRRFDAAQANRKKVRETAKGWGGYVGEACLFFSDQERAGGAFVVPLRSLTVAQVELTAFVLYRLPAESSLDAAIAVRDVLPFRKHAAEEPEAEAELLDPAPETSVKRSRKKR